MLATELAMKFHEAVRQTPGLTNSYQRGLQALRPSARGRSVCPARHRVTGSVDLDEALKPLFPADPRWDYVIGCKREQGHEHLYWVEIHPAKPGEVRQVLSKFSWLRRWLVKDGVRLNDLPASYHWLASGKTAITRQSASYRRLAKSGLHLAGRQLTLG
jgi:hypothetical protein